MKKIFYFVFLVTLIGTQIINASNYTIESDIEFIDIDPAKSENSFSLTALKVKDIEFEDTIYSIDLSSSIDEKDPIQSFEKIIKSHNNEYLSSLGFKY